MALVMSRIRKKAIADLILEEKFRLADFGMQPDGESAFRINYKPLPDYYFSCDKDGLVFFCPGPDGTLKRSIKALSWNNKMDLVEEWAVSLRRNVDAGDPWTHEEQNFQHINVESQSNFNEEDRNWVDEKLDIILEALKDFSTDLNRMKEDLAYLSGKSSSTSKKDWYMMFMGTFMGWMTNAVIPADKTHEAWEIIQQTFSEGSKLLT